MVNFQSGLKLHKQYTYSMVGQYVVIAHTVDQD